MQPDNRLSEFLEELGRQAACTVRHDLLTRALFSTDASLYQRVPHAVIWPANVDDIRMAVEVAGRHQIPVTARAAGTSLAGQAVNEALIVDVSRHLDRLVEVNAEERWARVQPGIVIDDLNAALRPVGLQFGPDPASSSRSTIGGAVANNATGSHSIVYGMSADHVLGMEVVLSDGTIARFGSSSRDTPASTQAQITDKIRNLVAGERNRRIIRDGTPRHWRRCGGYNLDRLLSDEPVDLSAMVCGSEGTLAIMSEITVNLVPVPAHTILALLDFDDLYRSLEAVPAILETGPSAIELLDDLSLRMCYDVAEYARLLASVIDGRPHSLLIVEYSGGSLSETRAGVERLRRLVEQGRSGAGRLTIAETPAHQAAIWSVRKVGLGLLMSLKGDMKPVPFIEDAAVPVEHLPDYVRQIEEYCRGLDTPISYYAHASAGCLHIRPLINTRSAREIAKMPDIARFSAELVKGYGGALSSEHGDGRSRSWLNEMFYGPELQELYRQVKTIFDPQGLLNPGIIVDAGPMTAGLRLPPVDKESPRLDFRDYSPVANEQIRVVSQVNQDQPPPNGFVRAIEMCNGAGVCIQRRSGTMCPSYMVTRDEVHSTRGRANALRATMTGVLPAADLTSPRMYEVLDLCISCKACKAECPSAVDMARLKLEFLARYHEVHGVPLRTRLFGHIADLNRLGGGRLAGVANRTARSGLLRRWLGISAQRRLPPFARVPFDRWWQARRSGNTAGRPDVLKHGRIALLVDVFTNYNYPEIGIAAVEFLEAAGYDVLVPPVRDEGRAFISKGLLREAREAAKRAIDVLEPLAGQGLPIVGLEPSSLLTLRDEYTYLLPEDPRVPVVAAQAWTFEEFVSRQAEAGNLAVRFRREERLLLLHGHCHQKALVGTAAAHRALSLPPGYRVEEVDSGCCGMAGSFGYEAEHYEISMQMAERRLLPAVRAAEAETLIVAAGVSCRQQIAHGTEREALHPAQVLRNALEVG